MPYTLQVNEKDLTISTKKFASNIKEAGLKDVNIEGAVVIKDKLLLANRGNNKSAENHLIITSPTFFLQQKEAPLKIAKLKFEVKSSVFVGVSGLAYIPSKDILLFTASTEDTRNSTDDGRIGDSYLGWIDKISTRLDGGVVTAVNIINLSKQDDGFDGHKIESVCVEKTVGNTATLHLLSDNDDGKSTLFKVAINL